MLYKVSPFATVCSFAWAKKEREREKKRIKNAKRKNFFMSS